MSCEDKHIKNKCSKECNDQLALIARVGRGIKGDSFKVTCHELGENEDHTILKGWVYDEASKSWSSEPVWESENINGGRLKMWYRLNVMDVPTTFQMTYAYEREGRTEWHWTSPAIPYTYYPEPIIGSDVAAVYLKDHKQESNKMYKEMTVYPKDARDREAFNTPLPPGGKTCRTDTFLKEDDLLSNGSAWGVSLDILEFKEAVKVLGLSDSQLRDIIQEKLGKIKPSDRESETWNETFTGIESDNVKDYIDDMLEAESSHRASKDKELEKRIEKLEQYITSLTGAYEGVIRTILDKFYGGGTLNITRNPIPSGGVDIDHINEYTVKFGADGKAAVGNINIHGLPSGSDGGSILTHTGDSSGDIKAI